MHDGLADQETVERIVMQLGQQRNVEGRFFVQGQALNSVCFPLVRDEFRWIGVGERQFSDRVLERDFPRRDRAQVNLVGRIGKDSMGPR